MPITVPAAAMPAIQPAVMLCRGRLGRLSLPVELCPASSSSPAATMSFSCELLLARGHDALLLAYGNVELVAGELHLHLSQREDEPV